MPLGTSSEFAAIGRPLTNKHILVRRRWDRTVSPQQKLESQSAAGYYVIVEPLIEGSRSHVTYLHTTAAGLPKSW